MFAWVTPLAAAGDTSKLPPTAAERISLSSVKKSSSSVKKLDKTQIIDQKLKLWWIKLHISLAQRDVN